MKREIINNCPSTIPLPRFSMVMRAKKSEDMRAIPAESPSILSNRLKAFVIPTIQKMLIKVLKVYDSNQSILKPKNTIKAAATICPTSLVWGDTW